MKVIRKYWKMGIDKIKLFIDFVGVKKLFLYTLSFLVVLFITLSFFQQKTLNAYVETRNLSHQYHDVKVSDELLEIPTYTEIYNGYLESDLTWYNTYTTFPVSLTSGTTHISDVIDVNSADVLSKYQAFLNNENFSDEVYLIDRSSTVTYTLPNDFATGIYYLGIDYYDYTSRIDENKLNMTINGEHIYYEMQTITLPSLWSFDTTEFSLDRYNNEIQPSSSKVVRWHHQPLYDVKGQHPGLFAFELKAGDIIEFSYVNNELLLGNLTLESQEDIESYETYLNKYPNATLMNAKYEISARDIYTRTDPSIRLRSDQNSANMYYHTQYLMLNVVFSDSWQNGGQTIQYKVNVEQSGFYNLSVKYRQNLVKDMPVFRKIRINGEVPFDLFESYAFPYSISFLNRTFVDSSNEPLKIYLEAGENEISFEAVNYPYRTAIEKIKETMSDIQELSLAIKKLYSNTNSQNQDFEVEKRIGNVKSRMLVWADEIETLYESLSELSQISTPAEISGLMVSVKRLRSLANNVDSLPYKLVQLSDGDASINNLLGGVMQRLLRTGMEFERITVSGHQKLSSPHANIFVSIYESTARLVLSFINNPYAITGTKVDELVVWVNHPRQYIEIMQKMTDDYRLLNPQMKRITFSQMPDQNKLVLANASGTAPDVVVGIDHWIPYDFAIRDAALDLRQFEGYETLVKDFSKGAMIPYIFEEGVFGLPETQNFWVTYYRKDILRLIGIDTIPDTWDEVTSILSTLQTYGMNYFVPLAQFSGLKPFVATLPFIYQFGGDLYTENGMQTAINSEATLQGMRLMSDLFVKYNLEKFVASFYNHFRYGMLPIGISDLSTYILLQTAAVELDGLWDIALHPGYEIEPGVINRYAASGAQASMILSTTKHKQDSWDFLSWWMSSDVQAEFAFLLQSTYGKAYFWNTANLEAFKQLSMPEHHKDIILEQWESALEAPRIPGSYMIEREISNAWTKIVFNGTNPRQALDEAVRISNREITNKMKEFDYDVNGVNNVYNVPSIYNVDYWLTEVDSND
ncbi:MAG: extracellular solute-binding protein [Acholeplasma sp.]